MAKQVLVIGLGQFGMSVIQALADYEVDVIAVDNKIELVNQATEYAVEALAIDATDEAALAQVAPKNRDVCICAIGNEAREAAILCTALLRQMGAPRILARATDSLLERILKAIGAHEVFNPEREFGRRVAAHITHERVVGEYRLADNGLAITELRLPNIFVGRTLAEMQLPKRHGVTVVGIQRGQAVLTTPDPNTPLQATDLLIVVSQPGSVAKLLDKIE